MEFHEYVILKIDDDYAETDSTQRQEVHECRLIVFLTNQNKYLDTSVTLLALQTPTFSKDKC